MSFHNKTGQRPTFGVNWMTTKRQTCGNKIVPIVIEDSQSLEVDCSMDLSSKNASHETCMSSATLVQPSIRKLPGTIESATNKPQAPKLSPPTVFEIITSQEVEAAAEDAHSLPSEVQFFNAFGEVVIRPNDFSSEEDEDDASTVVLDELPAIAGDSIFDYEVNVHYPSPQSSSCSDDDSLAIGNLFADSHAENEFSKETNAEYDEAARMDEETDSLGPTEEELSIFCELMTDVSNDLSRDSLAAMVMHSRYHDSLKKIRASLIRQKRRNIAGKDCGDQPRINLFHLVKGERKSTLAERLKEVANDAAEFARAAREFASVLEGTARRIPDVCITRREKRRNPRSPTAVHQENK